jgi:peptidoglycan hydrolase-like protein with peptidoglycan-binding domain
MEVPYQKTPLKLDDAVHLMVTELRRRDPGVPAEAAALLMAQVLLETGRLKALVNYNWGNLTGSYLSSFARPPWFTVTSASSSEMKALHAAMLQGRAPSTFRAYLNATDGLRDYLDALKHGFPSILQAAWFGDPQAFAEAVYTSGYCSDENCRPERTVSSYASLMTEMLEAPEIAALPKVLAGPLSSAPKPVVGSSPDSPCSRLSECGSWSEAILPTLSVASRGQGVRLWQSLLGVPADGYFGPYTQDATRRYQLQEKLKIDGIVGDKTWGAMIAHLKAQP